MKLSLSLCFAVLAAGVMHGQTLRPGAVSHRDGRIDGQVQVSAHRDGGSVHREGPWSHGGTSYRHRDYGHSQRSYGHASHYYPRSHWYGHHSHWPSVRIGYGYYPAYDYGYYPSTGYYPSYGYGSYYPSYGYESYEPGYGTRGLFWGGLAGAIIGHNSGTFRHDAWRGAAWGAGAGWLLGTIADANRRTAGYQPTVVQTAPPAQPAATAQPAPVTIINNYYNAPATPMSAANGLFGRN